MACESNEQEIDDSKRLRDANEALNIQRVQLILAEKRTSLAVMRTGIAVFTLPLSVITVLVATSRFYNFFENYFLLAPLLTVCAGLIVLGVYLVHKSLLRLRRQEALIEEIKKGDSILSRYLEGSL